MVKTPEEIKKGLKQCAETETCENCDYRDDCMQELKNAPLTKDALAYIQQLEDAVKFYGDTNQLLDNRIAKLESRLAQAERERDAALDTLHDICSFCKGRCLEISGGYLPPDCKHCMIKNYRPENTKEG